MKWWQFCSLGVVLSLSGCGLVSQYQKHEAAVDYAYAHPPLAWQFKPASQVILYTGGNDIVFKPSTTGNIDVHVVNFDGRPPSLTSDFKANTLSLDLHNETSVKTQKSQLVLALTKNVQQLTIIGTGKIEASSLPDGLSRLNFQNSSTILIQSRLTNLSQLIIDHVGQANIDGLTSAHLQLLVSHSGPVTLNGYIGLNRLQREDTGPIAISWINSQKLIVNLVDKDRLFLAGTVDLLMANVADKAVLDAKYLRAQTAFVNTKDQGVAEVSVLDSLNAFAQDSSNIYYYQQPKLVGRYYQSNGSVLYMGEKAPPCVTPECARMPHPLPG